MKSFVGNYYIIFNINSDMHQITKIIWTVPIPNIKTGNNLITKCK